MSYKWNLSYFSTIIIPFDEFGISHVMDKCLCAMFGFHLGIVHVSKDDGYGANNNVIRFIYDFPIIGDLSLKWRVSFERFTLSQFSNSWSPASSITPKEYPWRSMWRWSLAYWEMPFTLHVQCSTLQKSTIRFCAIRIITKPTSIGVLVPTYSKLWS